MSNLQTALDRIGKPALWTGGQLAAQVSVLDVKNAYGNICFLVRDCQGKQAWIREDNLQFSNTEQK